MLYSKKDIKHKSIETTPANLLPLSTVSRRLLGVTSHEFDGAAYCFVNQGYMGPSGIEQETHFRKLTYAWGRIKMRREDNLNNLPMEVLHEMITSFDLEGSSKDISCLVKDTEGYRTRCYDTSSEEIKKLKNATKFYLLYPVRRQSVSGKSSSSEAYLKEKLCTYPCTYLERKTIDYSNGFAPQPRLNAIITYVPEDHCYIIFGGIIAARHFPQDKSSEALKKLKEQIISEEEECSRGDLDASYKMELDDCIAQSPEVWKFDIVAEKWELLTSFVRSSEKLAARKFFEFDGGLLHPKKKTIYYWTLNDNTLFEIDLQTRSSKTIVFSEDFGEIRVSGVIDFSNDTLILGTYGSILVICLETHRIKSFKCRAFRDNNLLVSVNNFSKMLIFGKGEPSIYNKSIRLDHTENANQIDWRSLKKKEINPFLEHIREELRKAMTPYIPKLL